MGNRISIKQFARDLGISDVAVHKAIKSGKIEHGLVRDEKNRPWIIPDIAMAEWGNKFDPNYVRSHQLADKLLGSKSEEQEHPETPGKRSTAELKRLLSEVRLQKEAIELRRMKGELVEKAQVYSNLFAYGQEVRQHFEMLPDRTIDAILAARSRAEAHEVLTVAIGEALHAMSNVVSRDK